MKTKSFTLVAAILFATATFALAATNDLSSALQKGLFEEEANHNLDAAIAAYQTVARQFDKDRKLAATAIFRLGEVYRKQGKTNEANAQYERILRDFSDQTTLTELAQKNMPEKTLTNTAQQTFQGIFAKNTVEDAEIDRIKAMIKDSPDLINAQSTGLTEDVGTPLHKAATEGQLAVAKFLLANGADIERKSKAGYPPLYLAAKNGRNSMVELLLSKGADIQAGSADGYSPLHIAASRGYLTIAETLLKNRSNLNAKNREGATPLHLAAKEGQKSVAELLLTKGADVNANDSQKISPLSYAVSGDNSEIAKFLIAHGADVNSALSLAVNLGNRRITALLLDNKANPNEKTGGATPLHTAVGTQGNFELSALLLERGANPNTTDSNGETPLHRAIRLNRSIEIVELLLTNKADPNLQTIAGKTPLGTARQSQLVARNQLIELLLKFGANENVERLTRISTRRAGKENPVFIKGNQPLNRYTIIELIVGAQLPFPDLANVKIERLEDGGKKSQMIPVNLEDILKSGDCSKNLWLEWGDIIEIPELDHNVNEKWVGYSKEYAEAMQKCLEKNVSITIKGETTNSILRAPILNSGQVSLPDASLIGVVGRFLRASSDSNRIKVKRIDPVTKRSLEIVSDLEKAKGLRLIEGDQIEIPERDPNAPVPAANAGLPAIPPLLQAP